MNVLIVSHYFPPHIGGIEIVAQNQAKHLADTGHEVAVFTSHCDEKVMSANRRNGYELYRVFAINYFQKFGVPFPVFSIKIFPVLRRLVKSSDVVHIHDVLYISSWVATIYARIYKKPVILTQHVALVPHPNLLVRQIQKFMYVSFGKLIFSYCSKAIVLNSRVKKFLLEHHVSENKIQMIPNGVDLEKFYPARSLSEKEKLRRKFNLPKNEILVLFVGRFVPKKGFDKLLEADSKGYKIIFVGGDTPDGYRSNDNLLFKGSMSPDSLTEMYRACDIFILPSEGEGFPLTIQEAMASGLAVITSNDPGYDIYKFDHSKMKFITPETDIIKQSLEDVTSDSFQVGEMSKYSIKYANSNFNWDKNIHKLIKTYKEALL